MKWLKSKIRLWLEVPNYQYVVSMRDQEQERCKEALKEHESMLQGVEKRDVARLKQVLFSALDHLGLEAKSEMVPDPARVGDCQFMSSHFKIERDGGIARINHCHCGIHGFLGQQTKEEWSVAPIKKVSKK